jgi:HprK-related kinase A
VIIGDAPPSLIVGALRATGLGIDFGLVRARIQSDCSELAPKLQVVYRHFPVEPEGGFFDVTSRVDRSKGLRRYLGRQIHFFVDGERPFEPFPADTDLPLLEWGLNSCIAERCNHCLLLHAGVVERGGRAIVLPAVPGSGKSTLAAALATSSWRLLSDEFAAVRFSDGALLPVVRPIALKNESIELLRDLAPEAVIGPVFPKTRKGRVAHLAPDAASVAARHEAAEPIAVVFPKYQRGASLDLEELAKAHAFAKLATNSFNYELLGPYAFRATGRLVQRCRCLRLVYSDIEDAIATLGNLHDELRADTPFADYEAEGVR